MNQHKKTTLNTSDRNVINNIKVALRSCPPRFTDYLNQHTASKVEKALGNKESFDVYLKKVFGLEGVPIGDVTDMITRHFAFARRIIHELFGQIKGGEELYGPCHQKLFNADQSLSIYEQAQYALEKLPKQLLDYRKNNSSAGMLQAARGIHELRLLFYIALKYRDYRQTTQAEILRDRSSISYIINSLEPHIKDREYGGPEIDPNYDNPLFNLTKTQPIYWKWDNNTGVKKYIISDKRISGGEETKMEGIKLDIGNGKVINIRHITMRNKEAWSLINKSIRKGVRESSHLDYTGIKFVLDNSDASVTDQTISNLFGFLCDTLGDGLSWIENPEKEKQKHKNVRKNKDINVWKGVLRLTINGKVFPLEIQIFGNTESYLFYDIDSKSPIHHSHYKRDQLKELIDSFFPEHLYGAVELKNEGLNVHYSGKENGTTSTHS